MLNLFFLNAQYLDSAYLKAVKYVQQRCFGAAIDSLRRGSPDDFDAILKRLKEKSNNNEKFTRRINELKMLRNLRPCVGSDLLFRVDRRLENADLPVDSKHLIILPGRHALTRLVVLDEHSNAGHAGPSYTLMKTRQRFWIIHGISSVKHYIVNVVIALCIKLNRSDNLWPTYLLAGLLLGTNLLKFVAWITSDIFAFVRIVAIVKPGAYYLHAYVLDVST